MILYTILEDGGLSGIWTNRFKTGDASSSAQRQLFTEIARKRGSNRTDLAGVYDCAWIDATPANDVVTATLEIRQNRVIYHIVWQDGTNTIFTGVGMRLGPDKLVVTYWGVAATQFQLPG